MATNAGGITNVTLQTFIDGVISNITLPDGTKPAAAPNAWKDSQGTIINANETKEFEIRIVTNPDGETAKVFVRPLGSKAYGLSGNLDVASFASVLA